ncbi:unnamed protein product [Closterium sp. NIES-65]|nr:unnamed protein product [Closterium sp. NIES-65]
MSSKAAEPRRSLTAAELAGYSALPVHSFLGLRFLSASPHRVVATLISSPQSAQVKTNPFHLPSPSHPFPSASPLRPTSFPPTSNSLLMARRCPALHSPRTPSSRLRFLSASPDRVVATLTSSLSSAQLLSSPPSSTLRYYSPLQISLPPPLAPRLARSLPPAPHLLATRSSPPCHPLLTSFPPPSRLSLLVGVAGVLLTGVAVPCVMVTAFHLLTTPFPSACPFLPTCSSPPFQLLVGGNRWCPLGWRGGAMLLSVSSSLLPTPAHSSPLLPTLPHRFQPLGNLHGGVSALVTEAVGSLGAVPPHSFPLLSFPSHPSQPLGNLHGGVSALPLGNLHGGVSALVTEAVGSLGAAPPHSFPLLSFPSHPSQPLGNLHGGVSALPLGNLHGGVSALVTEAVGSLGAAVAAGAPVVGVEVACSHLRGAPIGTPLVAVGTPLRVGRTVQVWEVRLSSLSNRAPAQGESAPVSVLTFESIQKGAAPRPSHSQSPDSNAGPSLEPQQQLLPPDCTPEGTPEGFKAGRLLAVGRLTCVPLPQNSGGGANGENGNVGEANGENGNGGGEKGGNGSRGEALRRGESEALGNREEGSGEAEQWIGESKDEHEGKRACVCIDFPPFDSPPFNHLPIHKFIGLRFLSACPHRVVAAFVSSPATAQPFNNVHGGVSAIVTETLGSTGASLAAGGLVVGVEVAVSHLRPCPLGTPVVAVAVPLRAGRTVQVWEVRLSVQKLDKQRRDEQQDVGEASGGTASAPRAGQLLAVGRLTAVVVGKGDGEERRSKARL